MELPNGKAHQYSRAISIRGHCGWLLNANFAKAEADRGAGETVLIQDQNRWVVINGLELASRRLAKAEWYVKTTLREGWWQGRRDCA